MVMIMGLKSVRFKPKISKILGHFIRLDVNVLKIHRKHIECTFKGIFEFSYRKRPDDLRNTVDFPNYFTTTILLDEHKIFFRNSLQSGTEYGV